MKTHLSEESPNVRCEKYNGGDDEEWALAPYVGSSSGEEGCEADPEGKETNDKTRCHVDADIVLHGNKWETGCHHWSKTGEDSACGDYVEFAMLTLLLHQN
jgi:hypothetical protein